MQPLIYYVASSLDGYIAGPGGDVSQFIMQGDSLQDYQSALSTFKTVIMGRKTYEFGYAFGLAAGQPAYAGMRHHIISNTLKLEQAHPDVLVEPPSADRIRAIKTAATSPIYLCGGGQLAAWLLALGVIDEVRIKLNPVILGAGTRLFGDNSAAKPLQLYASQHFDDGLQLLKYHVLN